MGEDPIRDLLLSVDPSTPKAKLDAIVAQETQGRYKTADDYLIDTAPLGAAEALEDIDRAFAILDETDSATGFKGQLGRGFGGTKAHDLQALLTSPSARAFFEAAGKASEEGVTLTPLSDPDREFLASVRGSLDTSQSEPQLRKTLERTRNLMVRLVGTDPAGVRKDREVKARVDEVSQQSPHIPERSRGAVGAVMQMLLGESGNVGDAVKQGISDAFPTISPNERQLRSPAPRPQNVLDAAGVAAGGVGRAALQGSKVARTALTGAAALSLDEIEKRTGLPVNVIKRVLGAAGIGGE